MPKVLNKYKDEIPPDAVYIGRGSPWGNPYPIDADHDRESVIKEFEKYILEMGWILEKAKRELAGRDLVCFCAPKPCHGDILLKIANS